MSDPKPTRSQGDLAEMLEMLLDKGVVVNADVAVSIGDTELLGIELRAAIASFETAAQYGLEFPTGTDMERVETAAGVSSDSSDSPDAGSGSGQMDEHEPSGEERASISNTTPQESE
ncbi:gas vesicle protein GvpJ [Halopenitus sp. H-Gu1]|uniref:gas vesicle protein GvpJ n=1 Tax=Halopenitus sp. H-Gu1 TaxID=3242697 RepID=UPI00359D404E